LGEITPKGIAMRRTRLHVVLMVIAWAGGTVPAAAQTTDQPPPAAGDTKEMAEARQRYQRGLQLFKESNFDAARVEFERAYQLAPSYRILYNIGLAYEQLGDYVQARSALERYLQQGGDAITSARRTEVTKELEQIRPRIARVTVKTNVAGAEMLIDETCGTESVSGNVNCSATPGLAREVLVNPGRRRVTVRHAGYFPETRSITVAGSDRVDILIELKKLPEAYKEQPKNPFVLPTIIGFSVTGAAAIAGVVTGVLAQKANADENRMLGQVPVSRSSLDDAQSKKRTLATVTDVLFVGTGVAAGASTYFLIRALGWKGEKSELNVHVGAGNVDVLARF
jgi:tetratricopeptide (TPR) repeat protein